MSDILTFLRARLDEDEAAAKWASKGPWKLRAGGYVVGGPNDRDGGPAVSVATGAQQWNGNHIIRHDPARVLREVAAKRELIAECENDHAGNSPDHYDGYWAAAFAFAAVYSDHSDYDSDWRLLTSIAPESP